MKFSQQYSELIKLARLSWDRYDWTSSESPTTGPQRPYPQHHKPAYSLPCQRRLVSMFLMDSLRSVNGFNENYAMISRLQGLRPLLRSRVSPG